MQNPPPSVSHPIFEKDSSGYNKKKNTLTETQVKKIRSLCEESKIEYEYIFQKDHLQAESKEKNDFKRGQQFMKNILTQRLSDEIREIVQKKIREVYPNHSINGEGKVIRSEPGCGKQMKHYDYNPYDESIRSTFPVSLFVAISDACSLRIHSNDGLRVQSVTYHSGDLLIVNGMNLHSGASSKLTNYRLFFTASLLNMSQKPPVKTT